MSEAIPEMDLSQVEIRIRAQYAKDIYSRLARLLNIHFEGDIYFLSEQVDEMYIRLRHTLLGIVNTQGLEELYQALPAELPDSLHFINPTDADTEWEYLIQPALNTYTGILLQFCIGLGASQADIEPLKTLLEPADKFLDSFQKHKREEVKRFWARAEKQADKMRLQLQDTASKPGTLPSHDWKFVEDEKLRALLMRDYAELGELLKTKAPKSTLIMCGSILEAVLVSVLRKKDDEARAKFFELFLKKNSLDKKAPRLDEWGLHQLISVSAELGILDEDARRHADILKDYRNLIHPMVEFRRSANVDQDIVTAIVALLRRILRLLSTY